MYVAASELGRSDFKAADFALLIGEICGDRDGRSLVTEFSMHSGLTFKDAQCSLSVFDACEWLIDHGKSECSMSTMSRLSRLSRASRLSSDSCMRSILE